MLCAVIPRKLRVPVAMFALTAALAACSATSPQAAATVGDTEIADAAVEDLLPPARLLFTGSQTPCAETAPDADCNRFVLSALIQDAAVADYAEEEGLAPTSTEINETLNQVQTGTGGADAMRETLAEDGGTLDDMRELIRVILTLTNVQEAVVSDFSQADFEASKEEFATIDTAHILVSDEKKADEIKSEATTENFADLAARYSEDPGSGDKGGNLGPIPASSLVPEYSDAVMAGEPGTIIGPVQSQFGWHIIWIKDITYPTYEEAKAQVQQGGATGTTEFQPWMEEQMRADGVDVNPRFGTFDYETGQVMPPAGSQKPSPKVEQPPAGGGAPPAEGGQPPAGEAPPAGEVSPAP